MNYRIFIPRLLLCAIISANIAVYSTDVEAIGIQNKKQTNFLRYVPKHNCRLISEKRSYDSDKQPVHRCEFRNGDKGYVINNFSPCPKRILC